MLSTHKSFCRQILFLAAGFILLSAGELSAQKKKEVKPIPPLAADAKGKLVYTPDSAGNRIPDFSYAGYQGGDIEIPDVPVKVVVPNRGGDATLRIQAAINYVSSLPLDKSGFRGAVLLEKGTYELSSSLFIKASGVVLRGSGMDESGTILLARMSERETLIRIKGADDRKEASTVKISDNYVPVGAFSFTVQSASGIKAGDLIAIRRPSTQEWINKLGTSHFGGGITALGWKPGERDLVWERSVKSVNGNTVTVDAPLTNALDAAYGGASLSKLAWAGLITNVGVENISCRSAFNAANPKDEDHSWMAVSLENARNAWVRQMVTEHFASSAVAVLETASKVTVEDCKYLSPVSEIGGQRRYAFYTLGQQTLFQRCYSESAFHDFSVGFAAAGPNAFVQCESHGAHSFSGSIDSWASGILFDVVNIDGQMLSYRNLGQDKNGAGWAAANSMFWQCSASIIENFAPPTAMNWAFGCWAQFRGDGYWNSSNEHVNPRSLYYAQLAERLGKDVSKRAQLLEVPTEASSSPPVSVAMELTRLSTKPHRSMSDFIDSAAFRTPILVAAKGVKTIDQIGYKVPAKTVSGPPMLLSNGWLLRGGAPLIGGRNEEPWWRGSLQPKEILASKPALTRFVPGRTGIGLTDDLEQVVAWMKEKHVLSAEHNYGLWYDRRRDDHERIRRMDGEVWPPFYEQPFARSGIDLGWDGLSKYDLSKYDGFYWNRLKHFADLADQNGLVLVNQNYFQHNIIEAGAHWVDSPWRSANNINSTGFPEPPPFAGDKRIFMAEQFYDVSNPARRALHRAFIRQNLDNFKDNTGVIQLTSAEFTGPLHFVQFWIDVIKEWEQETGKHPVIGLSTTKDVQDAILADPARAAVVDLIDIRYWHYQFNGDAYTPEGGKNLAPRQHARLLKPKRSSFEQVYRAVSEYHSRFPRKAVMYSADGWDSFSWASFMAGGSIAQLPAALSPGFLVAAGSMHPVKPVSPGIYELKGESGSIYYFKDAQNLNSDLSSIKGTLIATWINPADGKPVAPDTRVKAAANASFTKPVKGDAVLWLRASK